MILVDANLLLYATIRDYSQHDAARRWLEERLVAPARVGIPWASILAFLRIITNPRIFPRPLSARAAWRHAEDWLSLDIVWVPVETEHHAEIFGRLLREAEVQGNLVPDAHLAALAIEHGLLLCSTDRDFSRFPGLRYENPLS